MNFRVWRQYPCVPLHHHWQSSNGLHSLLLTPNICMPLLVFLFLLMPFDSGFFFQSPGSVKASWNHFQDSYVRPLDFTFASSLSSNEKRRKAWNNQERYMVTKEWRQCKTDNQKCKERETKAKTTKQSMWNERERGQHWRFKHRELSKDTRGIVRLRWDQD